MLAVAAVVYALSRGRILFFPFVLILGLPFIALLRPPPRPRA
jgi:hypothetical protein